MKLHHILCLSLCLFHTSLFAQLENDIKGEILASKAPSLRFERLAQADGLEQLSVHSITQDSKGYLWISTQGGLHRYNGYEFEVFASVPFDTTSMSDSWAWIATESKSGDMWVTTSFAGLNKLDPSTGKTVHYRHDPKNDSSISSDRTLVVFEASNGDVWVSTINMGLNRMKSGDDGHFIRYLHDPENPNSISSNRLDWITEYPEGKIWVGSNNGINLIDAETDSIRRYLDDTDPVLSGKDAFDVSKAYFPPGSSERLWLATSNGLVRLNSNTGKYDQFQVYTGNKNEQYNLNYFRDLAPDPNNQNVLWLGGRGGITRFDISIEEFSTYQHDSKDQHSLSDNDVNSILLDKSGMMWVGTNYEGLNVFNPNAVNFTHIKHIENNPQSLSPSVVWGIYEDQNANLWVGTFDESIGHRLNRFDAGSGKLTKYKHDSRDANTLTLGNYWAFAEDGRGRFFVAGLNGLNRLDRATGKGTRYLQQKIRYAGRDPNGIFAMTSHQSKPNILWLGSGGGLDQFDTDAETFEHFPFSTDTTQSPPVPLCFLKGADGNLWLGTSDGLYKINPDDKISLVSSYDPKDATQISDNSIQAMVERKNEPGILWLGLTNGGGLNRFDTNTGTAKHYFTKDGLANNNIYGILEDEGGDLWMSTNAGISQFDPETERFRNYGLDDGLMALEYDQNAYFKGKDGTMYFGSGVGVTAFVPELLRTNDIPPQIALSDFKIFNKTITPGPNSALTQPLNETDKITLDHTQNEITIGYAGLHYANPSKNSYAYKLEGFDEEWVDAGEQRTAAYTNLPPGEYEFHVKAANSDGIWNENPASVKVSILPPWYQTWWAYLLFVAIFAVGILAVDRIQRYRLSRSEKERAALREAELRAEAENKRRADTEKLSRIGRTITSSLSADKIIETVYENVNALMDASIFGVGIYNKHENRLDFPATKEEGEMLRPYSNHLDEEHWLSVICFRKKQEIIISDFETEYMHYLKSYTKPIVGKSPSSILYLPLVQQDKVIGVITTQSFKKSAYSVYHVNLLRNLANYAAIALDNATAYRKLDATVTELQTTQQQLIQSEKMASLGELTAGIAHEIQNPLNFVNNFSDVNQELLDELLEALEKNDRSEATLIANDIRDNETKIMHHGKRAEEIVKSMLQHSRTGGGDKEPTDVNAICDEYLRLAYHGFRAKDKSFNADFKLDLDPALPKINIVPQDIGRVLLNLINNAFHAVSADLSAAGSPKADATYKPLVTVNTKLIKDKVQITVTDNGPGIPEGIKDKIFQPFFTTKPTGEGTGLGLSMSYDIVTKGHGGTIEVNSSQGGGTSFTMILPVK